MVELLEGVVKDYEWGSPSSIPTLIGVPEDGRPWAELWFGAHPSAPSTVGAAGRPLDAVIAADPVAQLGEEVHGRFESLPFLVKLLAAAAPLSLQAHPSSAQAEAGYAREDAAGIDLDAPGRSFRDRRHKPELVCALTGFEALCGFRDPTATADLLATIDTPALDPIRARVVDPGAALEYLLTLSAADAAELVAAVVAACRRAQPAPGQAERALAVALAARYPADAGVVTALLLNLVTLRPGEALFLGAGNLHAYLHGTALEVMANSDNVLRGGLTSKHVDVPTLLDVVEAEPVEPRIQRPVAVDGVATYETPVPEFGLARIDVDGAAAVAAGPAVLVCSEGAVTVGPHTVERGAAAWCPAADGPLEVGGRGTLYRVGIGLD